MIVGSMYLRGWGTKEEREEYLKHCEDYLNNTYEGLKEWNQSLADELKLFYDYCLNLRGGRN